VRRVTTQSADQGLDRPATNDATAQALVRAIPDPIFRIGVDGIYRGFKVDNERDLLTPADQVIGHSVHERLPPHIAEGVLAAGRRAVEEGVLQRVEYSLEIHGELRDYEGRVVACGPDEFLLIVRDFTERTRQAQELERERGFSYAVVRSTPSFLALVDDTGTIIGVNRALERAAGLPEESWLGLPFWEVFLAEEDVPRARDDFGRMLRGDPPGVVEYHHVSVEGENLVVDWTATEVAGEAGESRYLLCGLDVTARKHVEDEIRRSRARIVSASDTERKRLERNLHDGAQQHLVSVSHAVHLGVRFLRDDPDQAEQHLERALVELNSAHEELRKLARLDKLSKPRLDSRADPPELARTALLHELRDRCPSVADQLCGPPVGARRVEARAVQLEQRGERLELRGDLCVLHADSVHERWPRSSFPSAGRVASSGSAPSPTMSARRSPLPSYRAAARSGE